MDKFDEQEFYELMQQYRHTPIGSLGDISSVFEKVKKFIRDEMKFEATEFGLWLSANYKLVKNKNIDILYKNYKNNN